MHKRALKGSTELTTNYKRNSSELWQTKGWENSLTGKCRKTGRSQRCFQRIKYLYVPRCVKQFLVNETTWCHSGRMESRNHSHKGETPMHWCRHLDSNHRGPVGSRFLACFVDCFHFLFCFYMEKNGVSIVYCFHFECFSVIFTKDLLTCSTCHLLVVAESESDFNSDPVQIDDCKFGTSWIDLELHPPRQILGYEFWDNDGGRTSYFKWRNEGSTGDAAKFEMQRELRNSLPYNWNLGVFTDCSFLWNSIPSSIVNRALVRSLPDCPGWTTNQYGQDVIPPTGDGEGTGFQNISDNASGARMEWIFRVGHEDLHQISQHLWQTRKSWKKPRDPWWYYLQIPDTTNQ